MNEALEAFFALKQLFMANPLAQLVGLVALVIGASAFIQKDDRLLKRNLTLYTIVIGLHFLMLGLWASALTAWLSSIRTHISTRTRNGWVMLGFLIIVWVLSIPNAKNVVHFLPIIGTTFGTWALFREQGLRLRILMFGGTVCWVSHNFLVGSIGGTVIEASFLLINGRTMLSLLLDQQNKAKLDNS